MPVQTEIEEVEKQVGILNKDTHVDYLSLVRHGANQQPFRIVKGEGGEKNRMKDYKIYSILVPNGMNMSDLIAKEEKLAFLTEANTTVQKKFDEYTRYEQTELKKFEKDSMRLVKLSDSSFAVVGSLKQGVDDKDILSLSKNVVIADSNLLHAPLEAGRQFVVSFGDLFFDEMDSFESILISAMRQSGTDAKKRKQTVLNAFEAFKNFMVMGLDALGSEKLDEEFLNKMQEAFKKNKEALKKPSSKSTNVEDTDMTPEDITKIMDGKLQKFGEGLTSELQKSVKETVIETIAAIEKKKAEDSKTLDAKTKSEKASKALVDTVTKLVEKVDKIGGDPDTKSGAGEADDGEENDTKAKADADKKKVDTEKNEKLNVFKGAIFSL